MWGFIFNRKIFQVDCGKHHPAAITYLNRIPAAYNCCEWLIRGLKSVLFGNNSCAVVNGFVNYSDVVIVRCITGFIYRVEVNNQIPCLNIFSLHVMIFPEGDLSHVLAHPFMAYSNRTQR